MNWYFDDKLVTQDFLTWADQDIKDCVFKR